MKQGGPISATVEQFQVPLTPTEESGTYANYPIYTNGNVFHFALNYSHLVFFPYFCS